MRIILKKTSGKNYDISNLLTEYTWSGSIEQAVRSFTFEMLNAPYDKEMKELVPLIATGDIIAFYTDSDYAIPNYLLFYGRVCSISRKSKRGTLTYTCYDLLDNLSKSETNRTYNQTAEAIATSIANEFNLTIQYIEPTGVSIGNLVFEDKTYLEIINGAYKKAGLSTGKKYYVFMDGDKFCVSVEGSTFIPALLKDTINILDSSFSENTSEMVNRVNVYDSDGKFKTRVENTSDITKYGLYEKNYTIEKDVDMTTGANSQLHTVDTEIKFTLLGEINYWSGRSIKVWDEGLGLAGLFLITSDTHTWSGSSYTTMVNLKFISL